MGLGGIGRGFPGRSGAPRPAKKLRQVADGARAGRLRPEVPAFGDGRPLLQQGLAQPQVAAQRLQHVLPRPHGARIAHGQLPARANRPHGIGHDAVRRPVAGTDHVARARGGQRDRAARSEKGGTEGRRHQFFAALGGAVRIVAAHGIVLAVGVVLFAVLVALVARHHDHGARPAGAPHGVEHVGRAAHVDVERLDGIGVGAAHERLCRQMEHHLRRKIARQRRHPIRIAHVRRLVADQLRQRGAHERPLRGFRLERRAQDFRAQAPQPKRQPRALEARVARQPDPLAAIAVAETHRPSLRFTIPGICFANRFQRKAGAQTGAVPGRLTRRTSSSREDRSSHSC